MLFVRNPTGISHSPAEHAETADCLAGVEALADALEELVDVSTSGWSTPCSTTASRATYSSRSRTGDQLVRSRAIHDSSGVATPDRQDSRLPGSRHRSRASPSRASPTATRHAFHRALRGRTQRERGSFWTWREQMYAVAAELTPDSYFELARETYAEMRATGITAVGEFHYLHHQPDGTPYDDPNEMGKALLAAADEAGIRIRLLDTCYLAAGFGRAPEGVQVRYSDGDAARLGRAASPRSTTRRVGAAIHSVRAVPRDQLKVVVEAAARAAAARPPLRAGGRERGVPRGHRPDPHRSCSREAGALGPLTTAVHATHLTDDDIRLLGESQHQRLLLPDDRARPRRRHRPGPRGCTTPERR